eukprot:gb/GEZJ01002885.1/.p1 GENE.gb/GEZJ01002885.1/~~gb/GEZJ01002885.1/.p1  ORF type:complete len:296 (+),score=49.49 gb/GEZJ01002885.1/:5317-6204(+)
MRGLEHPDESAALATHQLIQVAVRALQNSAPEKGLNVFGHKDPRALFSAENVAKVIQKAVLASVVSIPQLAAAPLADRLMVLGAIWLHKCASFVVKNGKEQSGAECIRLASLNPVPQSEKPRGILANSSIFQVTRPATMAAALLLGMEKQYGEQEAYPRDYRFSQSESAQVVACLWEVTSAWERDNLGQHAPLSTNVAMQVQHQNADKVANTSVALSKHSAAALAISKAKQLRVSFAEKALGLHGSANGAGLIATSARSHLNALSGEEHDQDKRSLGQRTDWCPFDLVKGRPLPP